MAILGVDLGTSRSTIGYFKKKAIEIVADDSRDKAIPSVAFLNKKDEWIFGSLAMRYSLQNPERLIYDTKRMLGHKYNDQEIEEARQTWQFKTREDPKTHDIIISIDLDGETLEYYPYQISGLILKNLVNVANQRFVVKTNKLVVTIPATFNNSQREELVKAADSVGLQIIRFINEPISATIAYEFMNQEFISEDEEVTKKNILVFDLGAGTLDISFIEADQNNYKILAFDGDPFLGGRDWDNYLLRYVMQELHKKYPYKNFTPQINARIRQKCEDAKISLSSTTLFNILIEGNDEKDDMEFTITRDQFYSITSDLFQRCIIPIERVLKASNLKHNDIDDLIMVGGSTNMPRIHEILYKYTRDDIEPYQGVDPEEAVAYGACIIGAKTALTNMMSNNSLKENHNEFVDSDELEFFKNMNLLGVCNVSFKIELMNSTFDILIPNKFQIPCKVSKEYLKENISIQGGIIMFYESKDNKTQEMIGYLNVPNESQLPPNERIKIVLDMNLDGILTVIVITSQGESQTIFEPNNNKNLNLLYSQKDINKENQTKKKNPQQKQQNQQQFLQKNQQQNFQQQYPQQVPKQSQQKKQSSRQQNQQNIQQQNLQQPLKQNQQNQQQYPQPYQQQSNQQKYPQQYQSQSQQQYFQPYQQQSIQQQSQPQIPKQNQQSHQQYPQPNQQQSIQQQNQQQISQQNQQNQQQSQQIPKQNQNNLHQQSNHQVGQQQIQPNVQQTQQHNKKQTYNLEFSEIFHLSLQPPNKDEDDKKSHKRKRRCNLA